MNIELDFGFVFRVFVLCFLVFVFLGVFGLGIVQGEVQDQDLVAEVEGDVVVRQIEVVGPVEVAPGEESTYLTEVTYLVEADGDPLPNASVEVDGKTKETGVDGRVELEFTEPGTYTINATKATKEMDTKTIRYIAGNTTLKVDKRYVTKKLEIDVITPLNKRLPGKNLSLLVTADQEPVKDAAIKVGEQVYSTNSNGTITIQLGNGTYNITATKPQETTETKIIDYEPTNTSITIEKQEITKNLEITTPQQTKILTEPTTQITFTVKTGNKPVEDATVKINDKTSKTGSNGKTTLMLGPGKYTATATKPQKTTETKKIDYTPSNTSITVKKQEITKKLQINTTTQKENQETNTNITVQITTKQKPIQDARVEVNGVNYTTNSTGETKINFEEPGNYTLTATKQQKTTKTKVINYQPTKTTLEIQPNTQVGPYFGIYLISFLTLLTATITYIIYKLTEEDQENNQKYKK
ncbi:MAG: putative membrane-associated cell suface protein [Candidatus Methanohalarchaeum thermophilum]|uniref:Membrane-associated cell suface protein n=1 Tax=Methanohalarchaeum thermophilum TaxID=1903181 RepID=A0A1Q6DSZ2_METT1|nr:MAG: putative membrane-associated cell suface protein [Candidatus Methanohalarchaeum thermophilum]